MTSKLSLAIALFSIIGLHHCDLLENNKSYDYLCDNGTPPLEKSDEPDVKKCADCNPSYTLEGGACMKDSTANGGGTAGTGGSGGTAGTGGSGGTAGTGGSGGTAGSGGSGGTADGGGSGGTAGTGGVTQYPYICTNGNPVTDEMATAPNTEKCASCNNPEPPAEPNYILLESNQTCVGFRRFTCENGSPAGGRDLVQSTEKCSSCEQPGYRLTDPSRQTACDPREANTTCVCSINLYRCENGSPVEPTDGNRPTTHETETKCKSCDDNYVLVPVDSMEPSGAKQCLRDADADGRHDLVDRCPNGQTGWRSLTTTNQATEEDQDGDGCRDMDEDVDDDNDGLIEIHELNALHNIRWNPDGTSYDDEEDDGSGNLGDARGAPIAATVDCKGIDHDNDEGNANPTPRVGIDHDSNPTTPRIFLCGYELMRDLDFADNNSYANPADPANKATWCPPTSPVTDPPSCLVTNTRHAGFPGLGENFNAVFHGNGHTISHLYMRTSGNVGLFRSTASAAIIKQIGLENVHTFGSASNNEKIGTLVGYNRGIVAASHAIGRTSSVNGGRGNQVRIGGLVGHNQGGGKIIASYSKVTANSGGRLVRLGGLVGQNSGWIIACYATGNANSLINASAGDRIGGLVGANAMETIYSDSTDVGIIRASYATGTITDTGGRQNYLGGLVGDAQNTDVTASYATGAVRSTDGMTTNLNRVGLVIGAPASGFGGIAREGDRWAKGGRRIISNYGFGTKMGNSDLVSVPNDCPDFEFIGINRRKATGVSNSSYCQDQVLDGIPPRSCGSGTDKCTIHTLALTTQDSVNTDTYNLSTYWDSINYGTKGAWDFGGTGPNSRPKLRYYDYDGPTGTDYKNPTGAIVILHNRMPQRGQNGHFNIDCNLFPAGACENGGMLIPGQ